MKENNDYRASEAIRAAFAREIARRIAPDNMDELVGMYNNMQETQAAFREAIRHAISKTHNQF